MTTKPIRRLAAALAMAGMAMLPVAGCGGGTSAAPATVTVGPGGIATKAPGRCAIGGKYTKEVPVDCANPSDPNPKATYSHEAQRRADEAAHPNPWPKILLIGGAVAVLGFIGWMVVSLSPLIAEDWKKAESTTPPRGPSETEMVRELIATGQAASLTEALAILRGEVLPYPDDDEDDDDDDDEPFAAPPVAPAPAQAPAQSGGGSFLADLQKRLSEDQ